MKSGFLKGRGLVALLLGLALPPQALAQTASGGLGQETGTVMAPAPTATLPERPDAHLAHVTEQGWVLNAHDMMIARIRPDGTIAGREGQYLGHLWPDGRVTDPERYVLATMDATGRVMSYRHSHLGYVSDQGIVRDAQGFPIGVVPARHRVEGMVILLAGHGIEFP
ncbi:hypothetical protein E3E12_04610 [Formicincola oecophyllae]|uniref:WG repeat-containing protein n=1 Tax=Formicincola oecophyllae TaxID=2558361 RepID=A0A4Y6U835_9PROT|nr:hypothetical protein [Formicincola oecophyllae]QDH13593.2 hypothetical protein E3E12_04610 [Formicincola oecophyllae]